MGKSTRKTFPEEQEREFDDESGTRRFLQYTGELWFMAMDEDNEVDSEDQEELASVNESVEEHETARKHFHPYNSSSSDNEENFESRMLSDREDETAPIFEELLNSNHKGRDEGRQSQDSDDSNNTGVKTLADWDNNVKGFQLEMLSCEAANNNLDCHYKHCNDVIEEKCCMTIAPEGYITEPPLQPLVREFGGNQPVCDPPCGRAKVGCGPDTIPGTHVTVLSLDHNANTCYLPRSAMDVETLDVYDVFNSDELGPL